jgi:hypothetical protein
MLADLKYNPVDYLLFYSVDRMGRDLKSNIETIIEITKYVDQVVFVADRIATGNEYFKPFFLMHTGIAEESRNLLLRRLSDGRRAKVTIRKTFDGNHPPLGYVVSNKGYRLIPAAFGDELEATNGLNAVLFIYYCYLLGMSLRKIAKEVTKAFGLTRRGKDWSYKSVQYILSNDAFVAALSGLLEREMHYRIEDANIDPIIDPLLFQFVKQKLQHDKSGRKTFSSPALPTFGLCADCAQLLTFKNSIYVCDACNYQFKAKELNKVLHEQIRALILQVQCSPIKNHEKKFSLIERYRLQRKKVVNRIKELEERRVYIQKLLQSSAVGKMIKANTMEMKKAEEQLE